MSSYSLVAVYMMQLHETLPEIKSWKHLGMLNCNCYVIVVLRFKLESNISHSTRKHSTTNTFPSIGPRSMYSIRIIFVGLYLGQAIYELWLFKEEKTFSLMCFIFSPYVHLTVPISPFLKNVY